MVVSSHFTHFCYPISLVLHQHLISHMAYPCIPPKNLNYSRGQYHHLPSYPLLSTMTSDDVALVCDLNYQEKCKDMLGVNPNADEALA